MSSADNEIEIKSGILLTVEEDGSFTWHPDADALIADDSEWGDYPIAIMMRNLTRAVRAKN